METIDNNICDDECSDNITSVICDNENIEENKNRLDNGDFFCSYCNYLTKNRYDYNKHLYTKKHNLKKQGVAVQSTQCNKCNKCYSSMSNLWKHSSKCNPTTELFTEYPPNITPEIFIELMKQNKELKNFMVEQQKELQNTIFELSKNQTIINNTNNTNNHFNLNFFLNEKCKNAINITDFVESMQLTVNDIEETGRLGYIMGISRIFLNKLKELDVYNRPLHCTDIKREIVYIKDQDNWEKDEEHKPKLKQVVKRIARKNLLQITNWQLANPDCVTLDTPANNAFVNISLKSLGASNPEDDDRNYNKILKNVFKEVILDKDQK